MKIKKLLHKIFIPICITYKHKVYEYASYCYPKYKLHQLI